MENKDLGIIVFIISGIVISAFIALACRSIIKTQDNIGHFYIKSDPENVYPDGYQGKSCQFGVLYLTSHGYSGCGGRCGNYVSGSSIVMVDESGLPIKCKTID